MPSRGIKPFILFGNIFTVMKHCYLLVITIIKQPVTNSIYFIYSACWERNKESVREQQNITSDTTLQNRFPTVQLSPLVLIQVLNSIDQQNLHRAFSMRAIFSYRTSPQLTVMLAILIASAFTFGFALENFKDQQYLVPKSAVKTNRPIIGW